MRILNLILLVLLFSCTKKVVKPKIYSKSITPISRKLSLPSSTTKSPRAAVGLLNTPTKAYLYYVDRNFTLHYANIFDSTDNKTFDISFLKYPDFPTGFRIIGSHIFIVKLEEQMIEKYSINLDSSNVKLDISLDFKNIFSELEVHPRLSMMQYLAYKNDDYYIPYSVSSKRNHFTGKDAYVRLSGQKGKLEYKQMIFESPAEFRNGDRYNNDCSVNFLDDTTAVCGFRQSDRMMVYDLKNNRYIENKNFTDFSGYTDFDQDKIKDLGYIRNYETTSEGNGIMVNKSIIVIKRLKMAELKDIPQYEYYVLDKNLNIQYFSKLDLPTQMGAIFPYENGFLVIDSDYKNSYYFKIY